MNDLYCAPVPPSSATTTTRASVSCEVEMGSHSQLGHQSMLPRGTVVGQGEIWGGSPATNTGRTTDRSSSTSMNKNGVGLMVGSLQIIFLLMLHAIDSAILTPFIWSFQYLTITKDSLRSHAAWDDVLIVLAEYLGIVLFFFFFHVREGWVIVANQWLW